MGRMQQILLYVWLLFLMAQRVAVALVSDWVVYLVNGTFASAFPPEFSISSWILGHWVSPRGCCCSIAKLFPTLCDPMDCGTLGSSVLHHSPGVCSNSYPLSSWYYLIISSSATPFSFCLQSFPPSESFPMGQLFTSGGQSVGTSASASVVPVNIQGWFPWLEAWNFQPVLHLPERVEGARNRIIDHAYMSKPS